MLGTHRKVVLLLLCLPFAFLGCSDADPKVTPLHALDNFDFKNSDVVVSSLASVPLEAVCSNFISSVDLSFDNGTTWISAPTYDTTVGTPCLNNTFDISLSSNKAPWNSLTIMNGQIMSVQFRAFSRAGHYVYRNVTVKYVPSLPISQELLIGAAKQTGTDIILNSRARATQQHISSGGAFIVRGRILQ